MGGARIWARPFWFGAGVKRGAQKAHRGQKGWAQIQRGYLNESSGPPGQNYHSNILAHMARLVDIEVVHSKKNQAVHSTKNQAVHSNKTKPCTQQTPGRALKKKQGRALNKNHLFFL